MAYFQSVIDSFLDQIAVIDQNGYIIAVNKAWINFSKENGGNLSKNGIGINYLKFCQVQVRAGIESVLNSQKSYFLFEYSCHSQTEVRWFLLRATPFTINDKAELGAIISHVNITEQKLKEFQLQRSENYYRLITEHLSDFISTQTIYGIYTYISPTCYELLGYDASEMLGKSADDFIHPEDIGLFTSLRENLRKKDEVLSITYRIRCKNRKYIWIETKCQRFLTTNGECEEMICIS